MYLATLEGKYRLEKPSKKVLNFNKPYNISYIYIYIILYEK